METLQSSIEKRQAELQRVASLLARHAAATRRWAMAIKVALIILGAFAATQGTADTLFGSDNRTKIVAYTLVGVLVAALAGLETAFKFEGRAAELRLLAAECLSTLRTVDTQWRQEIGTMPGRYNEAAAKSLLDIQDAKLAKASQAGVDVTLAVHNFQRDQIYPA